MSGRRREVGIVEGGAGMGRDLRGDPPVETWPELTYRYVKHYYWEPQHLRQTARTLDEVEAGGKSGVDVVDRKLRSQEVPLNYLLNVLLRIAPSSLRAACLEPFGLDPSEPGVRSLSLRASQDLGRIQPDVHLESDAVRVFIELKVGARLSVEQLNKYVCYHRILNEQHAKASYLLLLVKPTRNGELRIHRGRDHDDIDPRAAGATIPGLLSMDSGGVTFGASTWTDFGNTLQAARDRRQDGHDECDEVVMALVNDFLADLQLRRLWTR
ncbi:MAG: hypothetical protein ACLQHS_07900 [Candidatus Limnocylindrales bacterium]